MEYKILPIAEEHVWEGFLQQLQPHTFLHSWKWGMQYQLSGSKIFRLGVYAGDKLVGVALLIQILARRSAFLLCPHGPLILGDAEQDVILGMLAKESVKIAIQERCDFIRFCPLTKKSEKNTQVYKGLGFKDAPIHMHPELSWILDVTKPEQELLKEMRKTTRYLIKKTEKEGVEIIQSVDPNDIELFWPIYQATVDRQHFTPFSKQYLRQEFEIFSKDQQAAFFFAKYQGEVTAAAIIIFYNGSAFYHHSGSIHKFEKINASYLLQWRVIQEAKGRQCRLYNFWGIAPENKPKHPWVGLSLFKKGFGGFAEEYIHAQDKPLRLKYWLNYLIETARRKKRGL